MNLSYKVAVLAFISLLAVGTTAAVTIEGESIDPNEVESNETIDNQLLTIEASNVISDGDTVEVSYNFPEELEVEPNEVNILTEFSQVDQSAEVVENNTVYAEISADSEEINPVLELDTSVTYPADFEQADIVTSITDAEQNADSTTMTVSAETSGEESFDDGAEEDTGEQDEETNDEQQQEEDTSEQDEETTEEESQETEESQEQDEESTQEQDDETETSEEETDEQQEEDTTEEGIITSIVEFFTNLF